MSEIQQPKSLRRMLMRSVILMFVLAGLFVGWRWYKSFSEDIDLPEKANTVDHIAAIKNLDPEGSQVVLFDAAGKMIASPNYVAGKTDKDASWRPDGNRLFFISDREDGSMNVYRWNPASNVITRRTIGTRSKGQPAWVPNDAPEANTTALITSGGFVVEFNPRDGSTRQVLPPVNKERAALEGDTSAGSGGQFDALYQRLGTSFKEARWTPDKKFVAAVMRREDGEVLIIQELAGSSRPFPIAAGDRVEFDVDPKTGRIAFLVLNFRLLDPREAPPEFRKDGRIVLPFRHMIALIDPASTVGDNPNPNTQVVVRTTSDDQAFHRLSISPDGATLMAVVGKYDGVGGIDPDGIVVLPAQEGGAGGASQLHRGKIYEPSWHPSSNKIAFIQRNEKGERSVFVINRDGSGLRDVSGGNGDFAWPKFSPQLPK